MWWPVRLLLFFWFRIDISSSIGALLHLSARLKRKKRNWAIFPERGRPLSGQGSSLLFLVNCSLYDELSCFLGSTRPSTLRPKQELKNDVSFDIRREVFDLPALRFQTCRQKNGNSESRSRWIPIFISIHGDTYLYGERSIYESI